jgi:hypothetical protein
MGRPVTLVSLLVGSALALGLPAPRVAAAELEAAASEAYDRYVEQATQAFLTRRNATRSAHETRADGKSSPRDGQVVARPAREDGIIEVPGGLVHHWFGTTFIGGATMADTLKVSYAYDHYDEVYRPVIASQFLGKDGDAYRVRLRIKEGAAGISGVLDVTSRIRYVFPESGAAYSISASDEIREVKNAGSATERLLPAGQGSGYLWRAATFNLFVEREGGVLLEMETIGLSREFPPLLGWIVEPIARRFGRQSVELSLQEFSRAVHARKSG